MSSSSAVFGTVYLFIFIFCLIIDYTAVPGIPSFLVCVPHSAVSTGPLFYLSLSEVFSPVHPPFKTVHQ